MDSVIQVQILGKAIYILLCVYAFGKGMNPSFLFLIMDK